jgi:mevalonate kinase
LVGFYNTQEQYNWIKEGKYNFRMGSGNGSLILDKETVSASYLLLHTHGDNSSGDIWKITSKGPKVYSKENLIKKGYPNPTQDYYLVIDIEQVDKTEFNNCEWEFKNLKNYNSGHASAKPFTATLTELINMRHKSQ